MAAFALFINGTQVNALPGAGGGNVPPQPGTVSLDALDRNYDGPASLMFRWFGDWRQPPFTPDSIVELLRDGVVVFHGLLDLPRPIASVSIYPGVEYTAYDLGRALGGPTAMNQWDYPTIRLDSGPLSSQVDNYLTHVGSLLDSYGVEPTVAYLGGAGGIQALPLTLESVKIDGGFRRIAAAAPGVRVFLAPPSASGGRPQYTFVSIFGAPTYDLSLDGTRVPDLSIQRSIDGCAGAVKTLQGMTMGHGDVTLDQRGVMTPAWDTTLQPEWTFAHSWTRDDMTEEETALSQVYRLWSYAGFGGAITPDTPMAAFVEVIPDDTNPRSQQFSIVKQDFSAQTVMLNLPAIRARSLRGSRQNPNDPGRAKVAPVHLKYTLSGTGTIPIIINVRRFPEVGYAGTAYQLAPTTCGYERIIRIPAGVNAAGYVLDAHAAYSEPITSGNIPINGDLPADLWSLARRINVVTASHGQTGYEALAAPLMGIRVAFAGGGSATLQLSHDLKSELPGEGG